MNTNGYHESVNYKCLLSLEHQTTDLFLTYCGIEYCNPGHNYQQIIRSEHLIHVVLEGTGKLMINGKSYNVNANQAFYVSPNSPDYSYTADMVNPWVYMWVGFGGTKSSLYLEQTSLSTQTPVCDIHIDTNELLKHVQLLLKVKTLTNFNEIRRVGYLYRIISLLILSNHKSSLDKKAFHYSSDTYAIYAKNIIENSYASYNISDIAKMVGIDRSYLYTVFKSTYNVSPQEYLISCRLKNAELQLITTKHPIQQIASFVGYEDALSFSKIFKKHYSLSPTDYRLKNANREVD